jgi:hypothetical protein
MRSATPKVSRIIDTKKPPGGPVVPSRRGSLGIGALNSLGVASTVFRMLGSAFWAAASIERITLTSRSLGSDVSVREEHPDTIVKATIEPNPTVLSRSATFELPIFESS